MFLLGNFLTEQTPQFKGDIVVDRAGMRFLFGNTQFGKAIEDFMRLDFQLPS
jgi:hypothetical protein